MQARKSLLGDAATRLNNRISGFSGRRRRNRSSITVETTPPTKNHTRPQPSSVCHNVDQHEGDELPSIGSYTSSDLDTESSIELSLDEFFIVDYSPLSTSGGTVTVNDDAFLALMTKRISRPTLLFSSNLSVIAECKAVGLEGYETNESSPSGDMHQRYLRRGQPVENEGSSVKLSVHNDIKLNVLRSATVSKDTPNSLSILNLLDKCDEEFVIETSRVSEGIKETRRLLEAARRERRLHSNSSRYQIPFHLH